MHAPAPLPFYPERFPWEPGAFIWPPCFASGCCSRTPCMVTFLDVSMQLPPLISRSPMPPIDFGDALGMPATSDSKRTLGLAVLRYLQVIRIVSSRFAHHFDVLTGGPVHTPTLLRMREIPAVARTRRLLPWIMDAGLSGTGGVAGCDTFFIYL